MDQLKAAVDNDHTVLATKASSAEVKACVLRTHFDQVATSLGEALDRRASLDGFTNLQQAVKVLLCAS